MPKTQNDNQTYSSFDEAWAALGERLRDQLSEKCWLNLYISENGEYGNSYCLSKEGSAHRISPC